MFDRIVSFFMPRDMRDVPSYPRYHEFRVLISTCLIGLPLMLLFPIPLYFLDKPIAGYLVNDLLVIATLLCSRYFGHYRIPMTITALVTYFIIYSWIRDSGLIFSTNVSLLHMYLLCAIWADKRYGWWAIFSNLAIFALIYFQTIDNGLRDNEALYALIMNNLITVFFGGFLAYLQMDQERDRIKIRALQDRKITLLDRAVKERTEQLNSMREAMATDFHDETGNLLSSITRQASLLKQKFSADHQAIPNVESIIANSKKLYHASKDFLWQLQHDSDNPQELFHYLTAHGQQFYNQFDIAFSSTALPCPPIHLEATSALNLIYIFKEAMTNVVKHAKAREVMLEMFYENHQLIYRLHDDGQWKEPAPEEDHYGLKNMHRRCSKNGFTYDIATSLQGTCVAVAIPIPTVR